MGASTTPSRRIEQCRQNARDKSEKKRRAAFEALAKFQRERKPITKAAVARQAGVSVVFLRSHPDLLQAVEEAERRHPVARPHPAPGDKAKDQVITLLRRRLEEMKQQLAAKDAEIRQKQQEIDRLYGKLASGDSLMEVELRQKLAEVQTCLDTRSSLEIK